MVDNKDTHVSVDTGRRPRSAMFCKYQLMYIPTQSHLDALAHVTPTTRFVMHRSLSRRCIERLRDQTSGDDIGV